MLEGALGPSHLDQHMDGMTSDRSEEREQTPTSPTAARNELAGDRRLVPVRAASDVLDVYRGTPIEHLLTAQNLGRSFPVAASPSLFVATCIDSRVRLELPPGAAYELRCAGVKLGEDAFFQMAYLVAVIGIRHFAIISHDDCATIGLTANRPEFVKGMAQNAEWNEQMADSLFRETASSWEQDDPIAAVSERARELRKRLSLVTVAPLHYSVHEGRLYQIDEHATG